MFIKYYLYYFYYTYIGYPFIISVSIFFIMILIPIILFVAIKLLFIKRNYYKQKNLRLKLEDEYNEPIKEILFSEKDMPSTQIRSVLGIDKTKLTKAKKLLFTEIIYTIENRSSAEINMNNYNALIDYFQLQPFWEKGVKQGSNASKQKALRRLDDLNLNISGSVMSSLTYNRNQFLRKRARSHYMYFSSNSPYKFLDEDFDKTLNEWDKIEVHRMLTKRAEKGLPILSQWIKNSKSTDFQCFLIDEIKIFNQTESCPFLLEIVKGDNLQLRKHSIIALGEMKYNKAESYLINSYTTQPVLLQRTIIKAIEQMNTGNSLPFLKEAYKSAHDDETKIIILKAIYNYGHSGKQLFRVMKDEKESSSLIFDHVSNPLIKY